MRLSHKINRDPQRIKQQLQMLFSKPDFQDDINRLREKWDLEDVGVKNLQKLTGNFLLKKNRGISLTNDIHKIMTKYNLHSEWQSAVQDFIALGKCDLKCDPDAPILEISMHEDADPITGEWICKLQLFPTTTAEDIKREWSKIKKWISGSRNSRVKISKKFKRDREIFNLLQEGKATNEIYWSIKYKYGDDLDFGNIKKIISSYRKKLSVPKSYRKNKLQTTNEKKLLITS